MSSVTVSYTPITHYILQYLYQSEEHFDHAYAYSVL